MVPLFLLVIVVNIFIAISAEDSGEQKSLKEGELPVPKFIIPAAGGALTTRAIKQKQVASITNLDQVPQIDPGDQGEPSNCCTTDPAKTSELPL